MGKKGDGPGSAGAVPFFGKERERIEKGVLIVDWHIFLTRIEYHIQGGNV